MTAKLGVRRTGKSRHANHEPSGHHLQRKVLTVATPENLTTSFDHGNRTRIFVFTGPDETSVTGQTHWLQQRIRESGDDGSDEWVNNLAYTMNGTHAHHSCRAALIAASSANLMDKLNTGFKIHNAHERPIVGFVFTGQGAQWPGMGKELLEAYPIFRKSMEQVDEYLRPIGASFSVIDEILKPSDISYLDHPLLSEPICSALQISLVDLLASWGIYPDAVAGHSSGEIAAAYAAGILNMEDAMAVSYFRGVLGSKLSDLSPKGAMLAVGMSAADVNPFLIALRTGKAVVGCVNSPSSVTISGNEHGIEELETYLRDREIFTRRLAVDVAYHSHHMNLIAAEYLDRVAHIQPQIGKGDRNGEVSPVQFFSSVTGGEVLPADLGPAYWVRNLVDQVKFLDSIQAMCFQTNGPLERLSEQHTQTPKTVRINTLVEIGPHAALAGPIKQIIQTDTRLQRVKLGYNSVLIRNTDATASALMVAASLACVRCPVALQAINDPDSSGELRLLTGYHPQSLD
ncbi:acyl transferase/acyl hydrolase/lysophospholipase [Aspergillus californicus]